MSARALYLPARAKLNLVLRIVGRRADGYHLIETLFHALELHDDVAVLRTARGLSIEVRADRPELLVPADDRNLALRALQRLQQRVVDDGGFHVVLHKRIPNGGGLGGGSSDAAATLRLGNELLGRALDRDALADLGAGLGADVPFFVRGGGSQWGRGVGDELELAAHVERWFVLVVPPFGCDTAAVYKIHAASWRGSASGATVAPITVPENGDAEVSNWYCNELEPAAAVLRPQLAGLLRAIADHGYPHVRMSGSGSTLFVACDSQAAAERCRQRLQSALATVDDRPVGFLVTRSGPKVDGDEPREDLPHTVGRRPDPSG